MTPTDFSKAQAFREYCRHMRLTEQHQRQRPELAITHLNQAEGLANRFPDFPELRAKQNDEQR